MASITATWSPSSLQLRLALKYGNRRKYPATLQSRVGNWDRRFRLLCVAQDGGGNGNGNGLERTPIEGSWVGVDSKIDGFSGWSNSEGEEQSANSHKKSPYGGVVGAGVAGVLLLTGLTFAAFSLSKRNISRAKQKKMEPLTVQQETVLTSDDHNNEVTGHVNANNKVEPENGNTEDQTDISRDGTAPVFDQIPSNNGIADHSDSGSKLLYDHEKLVNGTNASSQEVLPHEPDFDNDLAVPNSDPGPLSIPESENAVHSSSHFGLQDFDSNQAIDSAVSTAELEENPVNVEPVNNYDADPIPLNTEQKDELTTSNGSGRSTIPNSSSSSVAEPPNNIDTVNVAVNTQTSTIPDVETYPQNDIENLNLNKMPQVSADADESSLQEQISDKHQDRDSLIETSKIQSESPNSGVFFSSPGIPAPSIVSAAVPVPPGKVLVPAAVDQVQGQALAALQALKVIEPDVQPNEICTRREYARWLVSASSALSRSTISKVYPAMYIENVTELAFDDITPEDPDFSSIQGLAEAGLIESRLSRSDTQLFAEEGQRPFCFSPEGPLSRQDLVSWKRALDKRQLPEADRKTLYQISGFIDTDRIHLDACPALVADISAGEQGIIALAFGYTRLFQPDKPVTKAQAAVALSTGDASDIVGEELARIEAESMAENAVAAHSALVAQVEKDINASFEQELSIEREKINAVERMAEEATRELERLRAEREEENIALMKERTAIESEMEVYSKLRHEVEDQLQSLMNDKVEITHEKERVIKLREQAEVENKEIARLQYELEVERKALSMARTWAEDEAKRVREHARALEEARERWERHGIKVVVDDDLRKEASAEVTWLNAGKQFPVQETVLRAENLLGKLKRMAADVGGRSRDVIDRIVHVISHFISNLKQWASKTGKQAEEFGEVAVAKAAKSAHELRQSAVEFGFSVKEGAKRVAGDCREGVEKLTQKFKT